MKTKTLQFSDCKIKSDNTGYGFEGYASVFGVIDSDGDVISQGAFSSVIDSSPKMFFNHDHWSIPIGKWEEMSEDEHGLYVKGKLTPGHSIAEDVKAAMNDGTLDAMSIGFTVSVDGYKETDSGWMIHEIKSLPEISVVTFPANPEARINLSSVKTALPQINSIQDYESFLNEFGGFSRKAANLLTSRLKHLVVDAAESEGQQLKNVLSNFKIT